MTKPLSLADRIRQKQKENIEPNEIEREKNLIKNFKVYSNKTPEQVNNRTSEQAPEQLSEQLPEQQSNGTPEHLPEQVSNRTSEQLHNRTTEQQTVLNIKKKPSDLKLNQYEVLHFIYFNRPFKVKGHQGISEALNIRYGTARNCITSLVKKGYIEKPFSINDGVNKGSNCLVNELRCLQLFGPTNIKQVNNRASEQQNNRAREQALEQQKLSYNSSSSSLNNTTTTNLENILNTHPELGYWRQKGITVKQITGWIQTAECTPELMIQYLCYCKFDMIDLDIEKGKNIKDVFNWFYRIIEKSGQYRKPKGYKSHQEKKLEAERKLISDREKQIQELKDLHRKKYEQERDLAFWQMMSDPEGDLYQQCFNRLSDFAKGQARKGGKAFEAAMLKSFDEITESSD